MAKYEILGPNLKIVEDSSDSTRLEIHVQDPVHGHIRASVNKCDALSMFAQFAEQFSEELRDEYRPS